MLLMRLKLGEHPSATLRRGACRGTTELTFVHRGAPGEEVRFAVDSLVEEAKFEPSVPLTGYSVSFAE